MFRSSMVIFESCDGEMMNCKKRINSVASPATIKHIPTWNLSKKRKDDQGNSPHSSPRRDCGEDDEYFSGGDDDWGLVDLDEDSHSSSSSCGFSETSSSASYDDKEERSFDFFWTGSKESFLSGKIDCRKRSCPEFRGTTFTAATSSSNAPLRRTLVSSKRVHSFEQLQCFTASN